MKTDEQLLTQLYMGVQYALYALDHPEKDKILPGEHISHYHHNYAFQNRVKFIVNSIVAKRAAAMPNVET